MKWPDMTSPLYVLHVLGHFWMFAVKITEWIFSLKSLGLWTWTWTHLPIVWDKVPNESVLFDTFPYVLCINLPLEYFCPKNPKSKYQRILRSPWDCGTHQVWVYPEKFDIDFLSQNFFLASPHAYGLWKKFWAKMSMLNFSRWLRNRRSSLKCQ